MLQLGVSTFCIVTGASKGIGKAIAIQLADKLGPNSVLCIVARSKTKLEEVAVIINQRCDEKVDVKCIPTDLAEKKGVDALIKIIIEEGGKDISKFAHALLIHNAANMFQPNKFARDLKDLDGLQKYALFNINGPIVITSSFLEHFSSSAYHSQRTTVVNVTSIAGEVPYKSVHVYGMVKAERNMFFRVMAMEETSVKIMNFDPGCVKTDLYREFLQNCADDLSLSHFKAIEQGHLYLQPDECARGFIKALEDDDYESGDIIKVYDVLGSK